MLISQHLNNFLHMINFSKKFQTQKLNPQITQNMREANNHSKSIKKIDYEVKKTLNEYEMLL